MLDRISRILFVFSSIVILFVLGIFIGESKLPPYKAYFNIKNTLTGLFTSKSEKVNRHWYYKKIQPPYPAPVQNSGRACPGYTLFAHFGPRLQLFCTIIDLDGNVIHQWDINWFDIWPNPDHLPSYRVPKAIPGCDIHSMVLMKNGDLVFNFGYLGLVRIDFNGKVVWRLPYQIHHLITLDEEGTIWACGQIEHQKRIHKFPNRVPPFREEMIVEISPEGKIRKEWSVADLLIKNGHHGLLYLGTISNFSTVTRDDSLHLNDVEPFPKSMKEGFFKHGDVMVSLRNLNTIFVFNKNNEEIKYLCTGKFVRQHDADFLDGYTYSVFDNNNVVGDRSDSGHEKPSSRIIKIRAPQNRVEVIYEGTEKNPFFTNIYGNNQWLPNGNLLITDSRNGRIFEIDPDKNIVWEYINFTEQDTIGLIEQAIRLPESVSALIDHLTSASSE